MVVFPSSPPSSFPGRGFSPRSAIVEVVDVESEQKGGRAC
jgi:hypothetical protein